MTIEDTIISQKGLIHPYYHTEELIQGLFEGNTATTYDWVNAKRSTGELKPIILKRYKRNWLFDKTEINTCIENSRCN